MVIELIVEAALIVGIGIFVYWNCHRKNECKFRNQGIPTDGGV